MVLETRPGRQGTDLAFWTAGEARSLYQARDPGGLVRTPPLPRRGGPRAMPFAPGGNGRGRGASECGRGGALVDTRYQHLESDTARAAEGRAGGPAVPRLPLDGERSTRGGGG